MFTMGTNVQWGDNCPTFVVRDADATGLDDTVESPMHACPCQLIEHFTFLPSLCLSMSVCRSS